MATPMGPGDEGGGRERTLTPTWENVLRAYAEAKGDRVLKYILAEAGIGEHEPVRPLKIPYEPRF